MRARRGSVLIMALWIIAILAVMVVSFAFEARQQAGIDVYVRERNRVSRLIDSGRVLGEIVLLGYKDAPDPEIKSGAPDWDDAFEDDRWVVEKYALKNDHTCTIGPILHVRESFSAHFSIHHRSSSNKSFQSGSPFVVSGCFAF